MYICEKHFNPTDYRGEKMFYLKDTAIPHNYNEPHLKVLTPQKTYSRKSCINLTTPKRQVDSQDSKYIEELTDLPSSSKWTPRKIKLKKKIVFQTKKIKSCENRLATKQNKSKVGLHNILPLLSVLSRVAKTFVLMQLKGRRRIWTNEEKKSL